MRECQSRNISECGECFATARATCSPAGVNANDSGAGIENSRSRDSGLGTRADARACEEIRRFVDGGQQLGVQGRSCRGLSWHLLPTHIIRVFPWVPSPPFNLFLPRPTPTLETMLNALDSTVSSTRPSCYADERAAVLVGSRNSLFCAWDPGHDMRNMQRRCTVAAATSAKPLTLLGVFGGSGGAVP
ncbi:hypothetical protein EV356DRAFT_520646 [Viridothelium virens]|uniref:Uncharacterized protein n=1 Tax=Viridothelium virens TaxID=1048519 RepID=A0A6A6GW54_VIRVR|nr:hypothetical protein EV356DRAFT_520646 [Viridothelium virens]